LSAAQVYDEAGKLICIASCNVRLPFFADREQFKSALAEEKADRKLRRDFMERRPRLADSIEDRLYRRAAAIRVAQDTDEASTSAAVSKPVRTSLDGQLGAIQRAMETKQRRAVGAEGMDAWPVLMDAMKKAFSYQSDGADDDDDGDTPTGFMSYKPRQEDQ
jgi:hypothetical protein